MIAGRNTWGSSRMTIPPLLHGTPSKVALAVYQEMRTFPDNLLSWKHYIIDPFLRAGSEVHMFISLRLTDPIEAVMVKTALAMSNLTQYVTHLEFYSKFETQSFVNQMLSHIPIESDVNASDPKSTYKGNPPLALMNQYYARERIGKNIHTYMNFTGNADLIIYLRSDLTLRFKGDSNVKYFNEWSTASSMLLTSAHSSVQFKPSLRRTYTSLTLFDHVRYHNYTAMLAWIPEKEDWLGLNDRMLVLTQSAFIDYSTRLTKRLEEYLSSGRMVQGEKINKYMLQAIAIKKLWLCYGVKRAISTVSCKWLKYGTSACLRMGLEPVHYVFGDKWLLPNQSVRVSCIKPATPEQEDIVWWHPPLFSSKVCLIFCIGVSLGLFVLGIRFCLIAWKRCEWPILTALS